MINNFNIASRLKQHVATKTQNFTIEQAKIFRKSLGIVHPLEEFHNMSGSHVALVTYEEFERRTTHIRKATNNKVKDGLCRASSKGKSEQPIADSNPVPKLTLSSSSILNAGTNKSYLLHLIYVYYVACMVS